MHECAERLPGRLLTAEHELERDFEARLTDSSTLAFRVAFAVLRHHQDAEDVAQEALVKAYRSFRRLRDRTRFRAWLVRLSWRLAIDRQRANRRRGDRGRAHADTAPAPSAVDDAEARERAARLWEGIDALPEKLRVAIVLAGIEGHDIREVALLLGVPEGTVKSRLFLARRRLKERLQWTMKDARR
jgi:RNA polymerase sigma-70 factor (ECF subfamily)